MSEPVEWLPFPPKRPGASEPPGWANEAEAIINQVRSQIDGLVDGQVARKVVPHQVTGVLASSAFPIDVATTPQGTVRYPVKFAADVARFRVHIRNYSYADATGFTGTVALSGLWWGKGRYNLDSYLDGAFAAAPTQITGASSVDGTTEWVSGWVTVDAEAGTDHLLSLGWSTSTGAPTTLVSNWTRRWVSTSAANAGQQAPTVTGSDGPGGPFDIWLECEIAADVPVVAFIGDSITVGNMYDQSFPVRYAQTHRVWPVVFGHFGGRLSDWGSGSTDRWTRFGSVAADAVVLMCGINDVGGDATLNDLKNLFNNVRARIVTYLGSRIFAATLLPTNGDTTSGGRETVRANYNAWIKFMRSGLNGTFDTARAVSATASTLATAYTWDGTHLSADGAVQIAAAIPHLT